MSIKTKHQQTDDGYKINIYPDDLEGAGSSLQLNSLLETTSLKENEKVPVSLVEGEEDGFTLKGESEHFKAETQVYYKNRSCDYLDVKLKIQYIGSETLDTGLQIKYELLGAGKPTWLIPGAFYKENRFSHNTRMYPRYDYSGGDIDRLESDYWAFRSDRASLPAVFAWNNDFSAALFTEEMSELGLSGLGFRGNEEETSLWINYPYREEPITFHSPVDPHPADCPAHTWEKGEEVTLSYKIYLGNNDLHSYDPFVREIYAQHQEKYPTNPWVDLEKAAELTAHGLYEWHYDDEHHILMETAAFDREFNGNVGGQGDRPNMHVGWVSGAPYSYALLTYGRNQQNTNYTKAAVHVLDKIAEGLSPIGIFWAEWKADKGWGTGWNPNNKWLQARTVSEASLFMIRALHFEKEHGQTHDNWENAVRSNLDFAVKCQREDGNFGSYYHSETGEVEEWDGAGGILWISALLEGAKYFDSRVYRDAAVKAGHYYQSFILDEFIYGAPEDVHLTPTSEDAYNAVVSYVLLYESDFDNKWLELARRAAEWMMTFRWSYNLEFPEHTMLKQLDFRSRGADQASPSNQHLHNYGLFCVPEMLRLWKYTEDSYFLDRTRDNLACFLQCIAREDGDFNAYKGMVTERYYNTNCFQPKGMLLTLSHAWSVGVILYATQEAAEFAEELNL
ncbi:hypothetical protein SAMN04487936_102467 [Halobacillus dabanensis]|uniref:Uncharacterized protein n=1 Tax=Halobacillus dabanensis TaxID=240302 RepID=A0A1I3RXP2_HALDA|nr:hypothetical protein [Halobacillus dabanensis]SFJ51394.1 hypothetical protein SAMN04487936_102467 [Halobacillus dabanensis]